ncbi:pyridoxal phosphate-dependent decarboxylase family protein [Pseudooctadecabacter sp.]|uniref:pyridoxal phosphate-dependent decarboxylase family protein n=1 Tax=Pseudooctadecabacter sp. TaxID=1966338 RepID=UPI0025F51EEC|nr:pyridoxal-dependent decarboxylase [Pseudooctadecabacter sp.]
MSKKDISAKLMAFHAAQKAQGNMSLKDKPGTSSLAGWFLGPLAENEDILARSVGKAVGAHCDARREYGAQFGDPKYVTDDIKASEPFRSTIAGLDENLDELLHAMHGSIPLSSYRNQSHMYWDITMPGAIGYFAAMLYNQNNVAAEASPVTTLLEIEVGNDLARMLGYTVPDDPTAPDAGIVPWAHITCDGSVANGESIWAARNLKYLPVTMAVAIREMDALKDAQDFEVTKLDGSKAKLVDLDVWTQMNLPIDEVIAMGLNLQDQCGVSADTVKAALDAYSVQNLGLADFHHRFVGREVPNFPIICAPSTRHYSWPKGMALIGLGANFMHDVHVDRDGRMRVDLLRETLEDCLRNKRPILEVVAVIGSTEESAVDPLADILDLRDEYRAKGLEFTVHVDGAWGGYFASMLREAPDYNPDGEAHEPTPPMVMSDYVRRQYEAFPRADTQTVDPHKAGFIPYPAGALCYRNGSMRDLVAFTAPVVFHGGVAPTVGVYGIEGSKPGAAAAGVYLSHSIIRPDQSGYGKLLGKCIFNSKRLYAELVAMEGVDEIVKAVPFQRLPAQKEGKSAAEIAEQIQFIREKIVPLENRELIALMDRDDEVRRIFSEMGSDQNIVTYALNFKTKDGWNSDLALMNQLTNTVYETLSISEYNGGEVPKQPMFVTASSFAPSDYGQQFVDEFGSLAGVTVTKDTPIQFLISTTQDPWVSATETGNYLPQVVTSLKTTAIDVALKVMKDSGITPPPPYR